MKRLAIIADNSLVVHAIRVGLSQSAGFQLVGSLDGRASVRPELARLRPDVVVVDDMPRPADALARLVEVAQELPDVKTVLLTLALGDERTDEAFEAGADAVLSKAMHPVALTTVLRETVRGNVLHRPRPARRVEPECSLTQREIEILALAAQGHTNGRIGRELWITEQTVKFHLSNTYRKLGVTNRTEATRFAYASGLVALDVARVPRARDDVAA